MRASHIAVIAALFAVPSVAYAQQDGPVGGRVGSDLSTSTSQPNTAPYGAGLCPSFYLRPFRRLYGRGYARAGRAG